ncbi:MAG: DnaD domain protein [Chloroflexi bacterium]|nr:DnaD domain protein [Chloroflexota bacterium]
MPPKKSFPGFPEGAVRTTAIPDVFFAQLLESIDDLAELKLTLFFFWLIGRQKGSLRYLTHSQLGEDSTLLASLKFPGRKPEDVLSEALERAVSRGTLIHLKNEKESFYFINDAPSRRAVAKILAGEFTPEGARDLKEPGLEKERPNIFTLYEENIGLLQPLIAEELREAQATYPAAWIEEAFTIAVKKNRRNWHYIQNILERWAREGKEGFEPGSEESRYRYIRGKYADIVKH